jgi:hypothetical protein
MPVVKCANGKWRMGTGPCIYHTQAAAERAYAAYRATEHSTKEKQMDDELSTMLQKAIAAKLGDGWIRAMFPTTVIYVMYSTSPGPVDYEDGKMYEIPWRYDEELGLLVGEETEVQLDYVEKRLADEFGPELSAPIVWKNEAKRIVYGPVLVPGEKDYDGDKLTPEKIEEVAHEFMKNYRNSDIQHSLKNVAVPVESYLMPIDVELPGPRGLVAVPKGTWMLGDYVEDDTAWQECLDSKRNGFSIMGVPKEQAKIFARKSAGEVACKRVFLRELPDGTVTHVSLVDQPCVPKAEFLTVKSRGFVPRLFAKKHNPEEGDMKKEDVEKVLKEILDEKGADPEIEALKAKVDELQAQVDKATKSEPEVEPKVEPPAESDPAKKSEEDEIDIVALKARVDEQAEEIKAQKAFRAEAEKKLAIKPESQGLDSDPQPATKSRPDYGNRDGAGRKIRS